MAIEGKVERLFSGSHVLIVRRFVGGPHRVNINWDRVYPAYDLAREWQILLAGLLVFFAALIVAWATIRAAKIGGRSEARSRSQLDLRSAAPPPPAGQPAPAAAPSELLSILEQLRSLIRSALGSLPQTSEKPVEKENSPAYFLCQRILHLRLDQLPPPATAQEGFSALLTQLNALRTHLKKDTSPDELSEILVQINASARNLAAALAPAAEKRRQARQETR